MDNISISTAQFENRSGDKEFNLLKIEELAEAASREGAREVTGISKPDAPTFTGI